MEEINKITKRLERTNDKYLFHDTRQDIRTLITTINICIDKINELVEEVNELKRNK